MRSIRNAPKHAIKLSLSSKLLNMVRDTGLNTGLNISQTIDTRLTEEVLRPVAAGQRRSHYPLQRADRTRRPVLRPLPNVHAARRDSHACGQKARPASPVPALRLKQRLHRAVAPRDDTQNTLDTLDTLDTLFESH